MIRVTTEFDFAKSKWYVTGKTVFNSKYMSWSKNRFSLDNYYLHGCTASVHTSPILGPSILTTWSK